MGNVVIASNRLPVAVKKVNGKLEFSQSTGGVATGLMTYMKNPRNRWIGWPGIASDELTKADKQEITARLAKQHCIPVFLTKKQIDDFYNGYSNSVLWPLFHNLPMTAKLKSSWWQGYYDVNKKYADALQTAATKSSRIWVHDYQLLLVPEMLRRHLPAANIGFFLHIPWPKFSQYKKLPEAARLVRGILGAQLAGFHTKGYVNNFLDCVDALSAGTATGSRVIVADRIVRVSDFPMGIDYDKFTTTSQSAAVAAATLKHKLKYRGRRVIAAVDRLDPSKGLEERLEAYREFLARNPKLHGKVVFALIAAPSRTDIAVYKKLGQRLQKLADDINLAYGTLTWQPVDYMPVAVPLEEVVALLQIADVAFIAPIRDGMNLVAKEYIASRRKQGVLILSQTAGAAQELSDALLVDPAQRSSVVAALEKSLTMPRRELKKRFKAMQKQLKENTVHHWAGRFMDTLAQPAKPPRQLLYTPALSEMAAQRLAAQYRLATKRLLLLDYDGTLVPYAERYIDAAPPRALRQLLQKLGDDPRNNVVIISGRPQATMTEWFSDLPVSLIAEHGALSRSQGHKTWRQTSTLGKSWKTLVLPVLQKYADLTPGATVEDKQFSLVWHFRRSPAFAAQKNLRILQHILRPLAAAHGLALFSGNKILEIKDPLVHKGTAASLWLKKDYDFTLLVGDDFTDEDMFAAAPPSATTVKVGRGRTIANYRLSSSSKVLDLLRSL